MIVLFNIKQNICLSELLMNTPNWAENKIVYDLYELVMEYI